MKKTLFLVVCCFFLVSCNNNNWKNEIQVSKLQCDDNYIKGEIKNLTDKYYGLTIEIESKNEEIIENSFCYEEVKPREKVSLNCFQDNINEDYTISIKNIEFNEKKIPVLKTYNQGDTIPADVLEYHFENIYDQHTLFGTGFFMSLDENIKYPYINEITYENNNTIKIKFDFKYNNSRISISEYYLKDTGALSILLLFVSNSNDELENLIKSAISTSYLIADNANDASLLLKALNTPVKEDQCVMFNDYCISVESQNDATLGRMTSYYIST